MTDGHSTESPKRFFIGDTTHDLRGLDLDLLPDVKYRWHSTHLLSLPGYLQCTQGMAMRFERVCGKLFRHCQKTICRPRIAAAPNKLVRLPRPAMLALTAPLHGYYSSTHNFDFVSPQKPPARTRKVPLQCWLVKKAI